MKVKKKINAFRRKLMHYLTNKIVDVGFSDKEILNTIDVKRVLICRPNHRLGNLLLITPLVQEVINTFPTCKIDLLVQSDIASTIFKNYDNIDNIIQLPRKPFKNLINYFSVWISIRKNKYDLAINVVNGSSSGRIATKISKAKFKIFGDVEEVNKMQYDNYEHIAKKPIYSLRNYLSKFSVVNNNKGIPSINIKLTANEIANGDILLSKIINNNKNTISLFTYATADKCYPKEWWLDFYDKLIKSFPNYNIIEILPVENISMIDFKAPYFYSKDIRKMCALMNNTCLFIGADSGIMHLANAAQIPTIGLFSRINQKEYQPFNNKSLAINTNNVNYDEIIKIINNILEK